MKTTKTTKKRRSKYNNKKTVVDGITFDSAKEAERYSELKVLEKAGVITELRLQVPYELRPAFRNRDGKYRRAKRYIADFVYERDGEEVIEDVKSPITRKNPVYRDKKLEMEYKGLYIIEV